MIVRRLSLEGIRFAPPQAAYGLCRGAEGATAEELSCLRRHRRSGKIEVGARYCQGKRFNSERTFINDRIADSLRFEARDPLESDRQHLQEERL